MARGLFGLRGVSGLLACVLSALTPVAAWAQADFVRGDANADGIVDISDGIFNLGFQFLGTAAPSCLDAADLEDNGRVEITDVVYLFEFLFLGGPEPRQPYPGCGQDLTADALPCESFPSPTCRKTIPVNITQTSPSNGEESVSLTRGIVLDFSGTIVPATVTEEAVFVQFGGKALPAAVQLSADRKTVRLFCNDPLPASGRVRVTVKGDLIQGVDPDLPVDADGDGEPGGTRFIDFDTASMTRIPGTNVFGYVFASEKDPVTQQDVPLVNVILTVEGFPEITAGTDANGRFELKDVPSPEVFVSIDGLFVKPKPSGGFYPKLGKSFKSVPGQTVQISRDNKPFNVYLPLITNESLVTVQQGKPTDVKMSPSAIDRCRELGLKPEDCEKIQLTVPADSLVDRYGELGSRVAVFPVDSARLPTPLPDGLTHRFDITVQSDAEFFDTPARITFPNVEDLPPGSKTLLMSFDHASNRWVVVGTMTVSEDGKLCVPDEGVGIRAPGWHNGTQPGATGDGGGGSGCGGGSGSSSEEGTPSCGPAGALVDIVPDNPFGYPIVECCAPHDECYGSPKCVAKDECDNAFAACLQDLCARYPDPTDCERIAALYHFAVSEHGDGAYSTAQQAAGCVPLVDCGMGKGGGVSEGAMLTGLQYYAIVDFRRRQLVRRGPAGKNGITHPEPVILAGQTQYREYIFDVSTRTERIADFETPASGQRFKFPLGFFYQSSAWDLDADGLSDLAEHVLGTDLFEADTDSDGISDGAELSQSLDPLDGLPVATGVLASVDTPGTAVDVCALNDIAIVADSGRGISVVDVSRFKMPVIIAQVDTPGDARRVACSGNLIGVADGPGGLAIVDVTDPPGAVIRHQIRLDGAASAVAAGGGFVFAGTEAGGIYSVDLATGSILDRVALGEGIYDLSLSGDSLFVLTPNGIRVSCNPYEQLNVDGQLAIPGYFRLFVGNGTAACDQVAYLVHGSGYATVDVSSPKSPRLIATGDTGQIGWSHIVPTGSRFGVAAVGVNFGEGDVYLYDLSDCSRIGQFQTLFGTPGVTRAMAVYNGLAYAADGNAGLQVVNYLAYDTGRNASTVSIATNLQQLTVEEGKLVRVTASVTDDVQVRNVEFHLNGERVFTDGSFPFEHRFLSPRLSGGPTFTLKAKATDTGGNFGWSGELTVQVTKDVTPPVLRRTTPVAGGYVVPLNAVTAAFSEAMDLSTLANGGFKLFSAGPDRVLGNADDAEVPGGTVSFLEDINTAVLGFPTALAPGAYRAVVASNAKDLAGIALGTETVWDFRVYRSLPPAMGESGIAIGRETVRSGSPTAAVGVFVRHTEPVDAFNLVVDHGNLRATGYEIAEDLAVKAPEFLKTEEVSSGRSLLAVIIEREPPHDFRTLEARDPIEVVRLVLDLSNAVAVNPVNIVRQPFGPSGLVPEFTVNGRAVLPAELLDGEVVVTGQ